MQKPLIPFIFLAALAFGVFILYRGSNDMKPTTATSIDNSASIPAEVLALSSTSPERQGLATATFGTGCFWCTEALFQQLRGVQSVTSGYSGGKVMNPTYQQVCSGETGHAEVIQVVYDPKVITFVDLLEVFWKTHDPTTLNQQGNDEGTQYRSAVFYTNEAQKTAAEAWKKKLNDEHVFADPIVTEITALSNYSKAEDYHQDYYALNGHNPYCQVVIKPKMDKLSKTFKDKLKKDI